MSGNSSGARSNAILILEPARALRDSTSEPTRWTRFVYTNHAGGELHGKDAAMLTGFCAVDDVAHRQGSRPDNWQPIVNLGPGEADPAMRRSSPIRSPAPEVGDESYGGGCAEPPWQ